MFSFSEKLTKGPSPSFGRPVGVDPAKLLSSIAAGVSGDNKWKLSNIGGIGTEDDKNLRENAAKSESEFEGAGSSEGIEVWRIEKFEPEKIALKSNSISFFSGDSYIILKTTELESGQFEWNLHFWIGKDSTQDESTSAAYFTVNIDDLLNQKPVQYREVQHSESALFKSYFGTMTYLNGGIDTGFKTAEPEEYKPRLLQMKKQGSTVFVYQVLLDTSSLNDSDVFILDNGLKVYQFNAKNAHYSERSKAMSFVGENIKEERNGLPEVTILDGDEVFENEEFWELLGGKLDSLPEMDSNDGTDCSGEPDFSASKKLFRLSNESGSLILSLEKESETLSEDDINEDDVWAITCDDRCFIYVGAGSNKDEKFYVSNSCSSILLAANLNANAPTMLFSNESDTSVWKKLFEQAEEAT